MEPIRPFRLITIFVSGPDPCCPAALPAYNPPVPILCAPAAPYQGLQQGLLQSLRCLLRTTTGTTAPRTCSSCGMRDISVHRPTSPPLLPGFSPTGFRLAIPRRPFNVHSFPHPKSISNSISLSLFSQPACSRLARLRPRDYLPTSKEGGAGAQRNGRQVTR